jgi:hypothetical protein
MLGNLPTCIYFTKICILNNPGANPTIVNYNASAVRFYNATGSLERFRKQKFCHLL